MEHRPPTNAQFHGMRIFYDPKRIPAWGSYKSKLGGWSGLNVLGLLYMELARFHNIEGWLGDTKVNWSIKVWSSV